MSYFDVGLVRNGRLAGLGATQLVAREGYAGYGYGEMSGVLDKIGGFLKKGGTAALDYYGTTQQQIGRGKLAEELAKAQAAAAGVKKPMPSWVLPAALGGGALVLILLLRKK